MYVLQSAAEDQKVYRKCFPGTKAARVPRVPCSMQSMDRFHSAPLHAELRPNVLAGFYGGWCAEETKKRFRGVIVLL